MSIIDWANDPGAAMLSPMQPFYVVAGATGRTGSVVTETLLGHGKAVRVLVHDAAKGEAFKARGAEVVVGELGDVAMLTKALSGAAGAYLLLPQNMTSTAPLEQNAALTATFATAIRESKVPHVVLLSSVGAHLPDGTGPIRALHHAEKELAATGTALTALRAAYFQTNWGTSLAMLPKGILPTFVPSDLSFAQVSPRDIGRVGATALLEGAPLGTTQVIELGGPKNYSANDVASALAVIVGTPVAVEWAPLETVIPTLTSFGVSPQVAELFREMYEGITAGRVAPEGGSARTMLGSVTIDETLRALLNH